MCLLIWHDVVAIDAALTVSTFLRTCLAAQHLNLYAARLPQIDTNNFPPAIKWFAEHNPVSTVTQAARELFGNTNPAFPPPDAWPMQHPVTYSLIWIVLILVIFVPLAINQYKRAAAR